MNQNGGCLYCPHVLLTIKLTLVMFTVQTWPTPGFCLDFVFAKSLPLYFEHAHYGLEFQRLACQNR